MAKKKRSPRPTRPGARPPPAAPLLQGPLQPSYTEEDRATVEATYSVGNRGGAWDEPCPLDPAERASAEAWLVARYKMVPGASYTVTWLRARRVVGTVCPGPQCRRLADAGPAELVPSLRGGGLIRWYGCPSCRKTWRVERTGAKDTLVLLSVGRSTTLTPIGRSRPEKGV